MIRSWKLPLAAPPKLFMMGIGVHHPKRGYDRYELPGLWCLHFYRYEGKLKINGESFLIRPGSCSVTPPGALLEYSYGHTPSIHAFTHFELIDNNEVLTLPAMRELGEKFETLVGAFEAVIPLWSTQPSHAVARVWNVLWHLGELSERDGDDTSPPFASHTAVERARHYIEVRLGMGALRVEDVAAHVGFSHNHFTRLFFAAVGQTPLQYIRARRVELARHLLRHSTLPAKAIAAQCGLGDLQAFNKTMRRELGKSPREVRQAR